MDESEPNNHICLLDNVISNTLCHEIITFINTSANIEENGDSGSNVRGKCCFPLKMGSENGADIINEKIYEVVAKITHKLMDTFPISVSAFSSFQLRKIYGATKIHIDGIFRRELMDERGFLSPNDMRELTVIIGLNDDYEGGEVDFVMGDKLVKYKPEAGDLLVFPSGHPDYLTEEGKPYLHGVMPSYKNNKFLSRMYWQKYQKGTDEWYEKEAEFGKEVWASMQPELEKAFRDKHPQRSVIENGVRLK